MRAPLSLMHRIGFITWMALIALQCAWYAWLFPPQHLPMWLALAIAVIPLLLPLLALRNMHRALLWVGILSLFYFCHGVAESWSSAQERGPALLEVLLTLLLIGTLGAGVKRRPAAKAS
ncbi:DUF2069 domain-containing protein [Dyella psychrodurans]|uniref:DUF2069 domain-containing protein n=1 Tax=Dyella psychrodurans TaxID=1927960 RepID=A0A370X1T5_9GAMM|nr:DUF2069 domain-containing protein [Dyella psychrodurans]RDS82374.1 DUF2069 domain-containing protein [Dyella psychrodurans]